MTLESPTSGSSQECASQNLAARDGRYVALGDQRLPVADAKVIRAKVQGLCICRRRGDKIRVKRYMSHTKKSQWGWAWSFKKTRGIGNYWTSWGFMAERRHNTNRRLERLHDVRLLQLPCDEFSWSIRGEYLLVGLQVVSCLGAWTNWFFWSWGAALKWNWHPQNWSGEMQILHLAFFKVRKQPRFGCPQLVSLSLYGLFINSESLLHVSEVDLHVWLSGNSSHWTVCPINQVYLQRCLLTCVKHLGHVRQMSVKC